VPECSQGTWGPRAGLWRVLGFNLGRSESMLLPPAGRVSIVGTAARPGNVRALLCVELSTLRGVGGARSLRAMTDKDALSSQIRAFAEQSHRIWLGLVVGPIPRRTDGSTPRCAHSTNAQKVRNEDQSKCSARQRASHRARFEGADRHSLQATDFQLTDHGVPQTITHFDVGGDPISLVVLFETSSRVTPLLPAVQKTGILITDTILGPSGETAIIGFNDSVDKLLPFTKNATNSKLRLASSSGYFRFAPLRRDGCRRRNAVRPAGSHPITPGRRRVLLVVSEASDFGSQTKLGEVLRKAQLANITIYSVGLSTTRALLQAEPKQNRVDIAPPGTYPLPPIPGKPPCRRRRPAPQQHRGPYGSRRLGGQSRRGQSKRPRTRSRGSSDRRRALRHLQKPYCGKSAGRNRRELHTQYTLGYSPVGTSETGYHEIKVSLVDPKYRNLKLRSRPGYYVASTDE